MSKSKVNHPKHYNKGKMEVIEIIKDQELGFNLGNVLKYMLRHDQKEGISDIKKALWYLADYASDLVIDEKEKNIFNKIKRLVA